MKQLLALFGAICPMPSELIRELESIIHHTLLKKKGFLVEEGDLFDKIYFLETGVLRSYYVFGEKESTNWIMQEGNLIAAIVPFFNNTPSKEHIQALEDCSLYYISKSDLLRLYENYPSFNTIGRVLTEKYYALGEERNYSLRLPKAEDRYQYLLDTQPGLFQRVPDYLLASYLKMDATYLSQLKGKRAKS